MTLGEIEQEDIRELYDGLRTFPEDVHPANDVRKREK